MTDTQETIEVDSVERAWQEAVAKVRESPSQEVLNLIVSVAQPAEVVPAELSDQKEVILQRVEQLLGTEPPEDLPFTHGSRIYEWGSDSPGGLAEGQSPLNQLENYVVPLLRESPLSRRALMLIGNPLADQLETAREQSIPAPQLIQFDRRDEFVHVTAYYRAHEIYFFWIVNFIELVRLQGAVCDRLDGARRGSITTISHNAYINTAGIDIDRKSAALAIETSRLSRMTDADLRALVDRALTGDVVTIKELDQLMSTDLDREGTRTADARPYRTIVSSLEERDGRVAEIGARLVLKVEALSPNAGSKDAVERTEAFLSAKSAARKLIDSIREPQASVPVIVAVQGLSSRGDWLIHLSNALQEEFPEARFAANHLMRSGLVDLLPQRIGARLTEFQEYYEISRQAYRDRNPRMLAIGHSYGSLIVARAAERFGLEFERIILVGSVVPRDFDWSQVAVKRLLNEVGGGDWISRAARFVPRLGDSGRRGFHSDGEERIVNVCYKRLEHSDHLTQRHMEAKWIPFLQDGTVIESAGGRKC